VRTQLFKDLYGDWENGGLRLENLDRKAGEDQGREGYAEGDRQFAGIVDRNGEPVVFYHGTADDIEAFDLDHPNRKDTGWLGRGVYGSSDASLASSYSNIKRGSAYPNVMPLFMAVKNPYIADLSLKQKLRNAPQGIKDRFTAVLQSKGFDGVYLRYSNGTDEIVAFNRKHVKSATGNTGAFDGSNPDIRFSIPGNNAILNNKQSDILDPQAEARNARGTERILGRLREADEGDNVSSAAAYIREVFQELLDRGPKARTGNQWQKRPQSLRLRKWDAERKYLTSLAVKNPNGLYQNGKTDKTRAMA